MNQRLTSGTSLNNSMNAACSHQYQGAASGLAYIAINKASTHSLLRHSALPVLKPLQS